MTIDPPPLSREQTQKAWLSDHNLNIFFLSSMYLERLWVVLSQTVERQCTITMWHPSTPSTKQVSLTQG